MHPELRHHLDLFAARLAWSEGRVDDARRLVRGAGVVDRGWWVLGPSPGTDPPEFDSGPSRAGADKLVRWRDVSTPWPLGRLPVDRLVSVKSPASGTVWAQTHVWSPRHRAVTLLLGRGERGRLWVNGSAIRDGRARLGRGWNRILVAVGGLGDGDQVLTLRLVTPRGRPVVLPQKDYPRGAPISAPARGAAAPNRGDLAAAWRAEADVGWAGQRAEVLSWLGSDDGEALLQRAIESKPRVALLLAAARLSDRSDLALGLLDRLLRLQPDHPAAGLLRASLLRKRGSLLSAMDAVRGVLAAPGQVGLAAAILEAELMADLQALGAAEGRLRALAAKHPAVPALLMALASVQQRRQLPEAARETFARAVTVGDTTGEALFWQLELARGLGRAKEALLAARSLVARRPGTPGHRLLLVSLLADLGKLDEARRELAATRALFERDAEVAAAAGAFYLAHGDRARGLAQLRKALALRPHQPGLRARLEFLDRSAVAFVAPYRPDPEAVVAAAPAPAMGARTEVLSSTRVTRLFNDGTIATWWHTVVRVVRANKGQDKAWSLSYDPSRQAASVLSARRQRGGTWLADAEVEDAEVGEDWYGLYYEQRVLTVRFDELRAGDVLVVERRLSDFDRNLYGGTYGDLAPIQEVEPVYGAHLVWIVPKASGFRVTVHGAGTAAPTETVVGDRRIIEVRVPRVSPLHVEPSMPGYTEVGAYAHGSTFADWDAVGAWYRALVSPQLRATPAVKKLAEKLTTGASSARARVFALYDFVTRRVRYVGLEFGEHGFKPYAIDEILERRFGDCKDKAALLKSLLAQVGIDSDIVLVRTRDQGRISPLAASAAVFDHAILYVGSLDLYLDATASFHGPSELPTQDQGASALVVSDAGARFLTLPVSTADDNILDRHFRLDVGGASIGLTGTIDARGASAPALRQSLAVPATRKQQLERMLNADFPGVRLDRLTASGLGTPGDQVRLDYVARLPPLRGGAGGASPRLSPSREAFRLLPVGFSLAGAMASQTRRSNDLQLDHPFTWRWTFEIARGDAFRPPSGGVVTGRFGRIAVEASRSGNALRVSIEVRVVVARISAADYAEFRRFLTDGDRLLRTVHRLERRP